MAGCLTDDNKVANNSIDCFFVLLEILEFHFVNIFLDLLNATKDIRNSMLPQSTQHRLPLIEYFPVIQGVLRPSESDQF